MNPAMMDIFVGITAEIISVLAIATRDIKQGRASELFHYEYATVDRRVFREISKATSRKD
jgi:hypothetical protein